MDYFDTLRNRFCLVDKSGFFSAKEQYNGAYAG